VLGTATGDHWFDASAPQLGGSCRGHNRDRRSRDSGRRRGRPRLPAIAPIPSTRGSSCVTSWRWPPVSVAANAPRDSPRSGGAWHQQARGQPANGRSADHQAERGYGCRPLSRAARER
jgi:hypothetical protein